MSYAPQTFEEALALDLDRKGINESEMARRLGITPAAVNKWKATRTIPRARLHAVADVLGSDSELLQWVGNRMREIYGLGVRVVNWREAEPPPPPMFQVARLEGPRQPSERDRMLVDWREGLPPELHDHLDQRITLLGVGRRFDYLSPRLALEVRSPRDMRAAPTALAQHVMRLLLLRELTATEHPGRRLVVALVASELEPTAQRALDRIRLDTSVLGVDLVQVPNVEALARLTRDIEAGRWPGPEDDLVE